MKQKVKQVIRKRIGRPLPVAICIAGLVAGCSDSDSLVVVDKLPGQGQHTEHTDIEQGVWPPQPLGMSNAQALPASARAGAQSSIIDASRSLVLNNPAVREVLGDDYIEFDGSLGDSKGDVATSFLFFSYSNNQTVEVSRKRSGEVIAITNPAAQFQPTELASEVDQAIALAQTALSDGGFETQGLTGTAMLAFPRASDATDSGQQFYPQRVLYVTFGPGNGEMPVYSALANLTTDTVTEAGLIQ